MIKIEKPKTRSPRKMKTSLCIPRIRSNTCRAKTNRLSPMTLLDRFREAVLRLIMLSALSKATHQVRPSDQAPRSYYPADPHHSEAVADCIEFIKKKASPDQESRDSTVSSSSSIDATAELVIPLPVM